MILQLTLLKFLVIVILVPLEVVVIVSGLLLVLLIVLQQSTGRTVSTSLCCSMQHATVGTRPTTAMCDAR
jgi:hypothetical protein